MARVKPAAESQGLTEQLTNRPGGAARGQRGLRPSPASRHRGTDQWAAAEGACALACLREARGVRPLHRLGVGGGPHAILLWLAPASRVCEHVARDPA